MKSVFELKEPPYNLLSKSNHFTRSDVKTTYYGVLSIKHLPPQIWQFFSQSVRKCKTLNEFQTKIKSSYTYHCLCRLWKAYIAQLSFIWSAFIHLFMAEPGYILVTIVYLQYDVLFDISVLFALFSFAVVTISIYIYLCYLYPYLLVFYVFDLTYYYYYYYHYFYN